MKWVKAAAAAAAAAATAEGTAEMMWSLTGRTVVSSIEKGSPVDLLSRHGEWQRAARPAALTVLHNPSFTHPKVYEQLKEVP